MKNLITKFVRDEDGAALVEYGIALLVVILVGTGALVSMAGDTGNAVHPRRHRNGCCSCGFCSLISAFSGRPASAGRPDSTAPQNPGA